jgi:hypothetical protein
MRNELEPKCFVNHIISLSPAVQPLEFVLLATFIKGKPTQPDEKNILTFIHDLFTASKPLNYKGFHEGRISNRLARRPSMRPVKLS